MKTFTPLQCLWLVAVYVLGSIAFNKAIVTKGYGDLSLIPVAIGGLITALLVILIEGWLYQLKGRWPRKLLLYWLRANVLGILWIALTQTIAITITTSQACANDGAGLCPFTPYITMTFFFLMCLYAIPLGSIVGIISGQSVLMMTRSQSKTGR